VSFVLFYFSFLLRLRLRRRGALGLGGQRLLLRCRRLAAGLHLGLLLLADHALGLILRNDNLAGLCDCLSIRRCRRLLCLALSDLGVVCGALLGRHISELLRAALLRGALRGHRAAAAGNYHVCGDSAVGLLGLCRIATGLHLGLLLLAEDALGLVGVIDCGENCGLDARVQRGEDVLVDLDRHSCL
jgi:hypothetical protein